jgi:curli production assembly/transport component CsgG/holdfast attachment protein HfaB
MLKVTQKSFITIALASSMALTGCISPVPAYKGNYAKPIGSSPVTANPTPYSNALVCLGNYARANGIRGPKITVGRILDFTGKADAEGGRQITQGGSLMAMSAFGKSGARLVERFDTSVSELELKYANNRLIGDEGTDYRKIMAGQVPGSDFYLVGGITELNYNIRSIGSDNYVGDTRSDKAKGIVNGKLYVMNVGLDLRLVDTRTLEVVDVISYQKQIIGREVGLGYFRFFDNLVVDLGAGERSLEPIQLAVRSVIERAVVEMMSNIYGVPGASVCQGSFGPGGDPMGPIGITGAYVPRSQATASGADDRADPGNWKNVTGGTSVVGEPLRGRKN